MKRILLSLALLILPGLAFSAYVEFLDDAKNGIYDNVFYDFVKHDGAVWAATGRGVAYTTDGGVNWYAYDTTNGLSYDEITAIHSAGDTLWLAINEARFDPAVEAVVLDGQGLAFTDNNGQVWNVISPEGTVGYRYNVYELKGAGSIISYASWAGGMGISFDNGITWRKVFYSRSDSLDYEDVLDGASIGTLPGTVLSFALAVDTFHTDSIVLWSGTADGLMRYVYPPEYGRYKNLEVPYIASGDGYVWICGDSGLTRMHYLEDGRKDIFTADTSNGLSGLYTTAATVIDHWLLVGTNDSANGDNPGLSISIDSGYHFIEITDGLGAMDGVNEAPEDFLTWDAIVFMAANEAGLFFSADSGHAWTPIPLDADPASLKNVVHSVDAYADTLFIGTDTGVVRAILNISDIANFVSDTLIAFDDAYSAGVETHRVRIQPFYNDAGDAVDSFNVYAINYPLASQPSDTPSVYISTNGGDGWFTVPDYLVGARHFDIGFFDDIVMLSGQGVLRVSQASSATNLFSWETILGSTILDSLNQYPLTYESLDIKALTIVDDTIYLGTDSGIAISPPSEIITWDLMLPQDDPTGQTWVDRYSVDDGLSGDFVNAMEVQLASSGDTLVWASTHSGVSGVGQDGISVGYADGSEWETVHTGAPCWNFAFNGDTVFAATNAGLLMSDDFGVTWDTLAISGLLVNYPTDAEYSIDSNFQVIAVMVDNDTLWVGSESGAGFIDLNGASFDDWSMVRAYEPSQDIYAYPTPYSPGDEVGDLFFHYPLPADAYVTLKVYDFAMNLVKTVMDNEFRTGGEDVIWMTDHWNGLNGKGDAVAPGVYYFKLTFSTGEEYWGKLAIEP